jgi:hypothetical protein
LRGRKPFNTEFELKWFEQRARLQAILREIGGRGAKERLIKELTGSRGSGAWVRELLNRSRNAPSEETHRQWMKIIGRFLHELDHGRPAEYWQLRVQGELFATNLADFALKDDRVEEMLTFYENEDPVKITLGEKSYLLPFTCAVPAFGAGLPNEQPIKIRILKDKEHVLPKSLKEHCAPIIERAEKAEHWNGTILRLDDLKSTTNGVTITFRIGRYFDAMATNYHMDYPIADPSKSLRHILHGSQRRLSPFKDDVLVNSTGVVIIIESGDGYIVVQERSNKVAVRANTRSSSTSGELKGRQLDRFGTKAVLSFGEFTAVAHEHVEEELAIKLDELYFLGLFREFLRGGKPELYYFGRTRLPLEFIRNNLRNAPHRFESREITGLDFRNGNNGSLIDAKSGEFVDRVRKILSLKNANMTLVAGLLLSATSAGVSKSALW